HTPDLDDVFFALTGPATLPHQTDQTRQTRQTEENAR
ncbi:ABC transporter, partial [Streptomyces sp. NPDC058661]